MTLTKQQDEIIHDEKMFDRKEAEADREDEHFSDWLSDNKGMLKSEFADEHEDLFMAYCREVFKEEMANK